MAMRQEMLLVLAEAARIEAAALFAAANTAEATVVKSILWQTGQAKTDAANRIEEAVLDSLVPE
jgi:hypothetical protein